MALDLHMKSDQEDFMLLTILLVVLVLSLIGGGFGHTRYGYASWSPFGIILVIGLILLLTGQLRLG